MRAPGCAVAALRQLLRLHASGTPPAQVLVVASNSIEAKVFEALVDLSHPIGSQELLCVSPPGLASTILDMIPSPHSRWGGPHASLSLLRASLHELPVSTVLRPPNDPYRYALDLLAAFDRLQLHDVDAAQALEQMAELSPIQASILGAYSPWLQLKERARVRDPSDIMGAALAASRVDETARVAQERWSHILLPDAHNLGLPALLLLWRLFGRCIKTTDTHAQSLVTAFAAPGLETLHGLPGKATALLQTAEVTTRARSEAAAPSGVGPLWMLREVVGSDVHYSAGGRVTSAPEHGERHSSWQGFASAGVQWVREESVALEQGAVPRQVVGIAVDPGANRTAVLVAAIRNLLYVAHGPRDASPQDAARAAATIGVFCRSFSHARELSKSLQDACKQELWPDAPEIVCEGSSRLADVPSVRTVMAVLAAIVTPREDIRPLFNLGVLPPYSIPEELLSRTLRFGDTASASTSSERDAVASPKESAIALMQQHVEVARATYMRTGSVSALVAAFLRHSGLSSTLASSVNESTELEAAGIQELLHVIKQLEEGHSLLPRRGTNHSLLEHSYGSNGYSIDLSVPGILPSIFLQLSELMMTLRIRLPLAGSMLLDGDFGTDFSDAESLRAAPAPRTAVDVLEAATVAHVLRAAGVSLDLVRPIDEKLPVRAAVVFTTLPAGTSHQYDAVVFPWLTDSAFPGNFRQQMLALPQSLFLPPTDLRKVQCELTADIVKGTSECALSTHPMSRTDHVNWQRQRLRVAMSAARHNVVLITPEETCATPLRHEKRSRFFDELFRPSPSSLRETKAQLLARLPSEDDCIHYGAPKVPIDTTHSADASLALLPMSHSRLFDLQVCPKRYYLSRILGLPPDRPAALTYGSAMHAASAVFSMIIRRAIGRACAGTGSGVTLASEGSSIPAHLSAAAAVSERLLLEPHLRAAVRAELPPEHAIVGDMMEAYADFWRHGDASGRASSSTAPRELAALAGSSVDALASSIPVSQRLELERCAQDGIAAFARRELAAANDFLCDPAAARAATDGVALEDSRAWLGVPALVEHPFQIALPEAGVLLRGVFDRIDVAGPGVGDAGVPGDSSFLATIREFKSSVQWAASGALKKRARASLQLQLYSLALDKNVHDAAGAHEPPAFVAPAFSASVTLESIETGERASSIQAGRVRASSRGQAAVLADLAEAAAQVRRNDFTATPSSFACGFCVHKSVCSSKHPWA
jgi:hypothetical protein